jgi:thiol-disulfide isomerase/thioredoxin
MKRGTIFVSILLIILFLGCDKKDKSTESEQEISEILLKTIDNGTIILKLFKNINNETIILNRTNGDFQYMPNKALLINFFTTSCVPCNAQFPHLNNLQEKYKDDLEVISVLLEEKPLDEIQNFAKDKNIGFSVAVDKNNFKLSFVLGNITNVPYTIIYDKNGEYATHYINATPEEMIEADLKRVF